MNSLLSKAFFGAALTFVIASSLGSTSVFADAAQTNGDCVSATNRSNLQVTWNATDNVTVKTIGDKKICTDTTLYFSSYILPDNYDGTGFGGPTSYPQKLQNTTSAVLKAGTNGKTTMTVQLPPACKGVQVDVYYGPEITTVTAAGHGAQYISGKLVSKTVDTCDVPVAPVVPVVPKQEAETPATPAPEVVIAQAPAPAPAVLPNTGMNVGTTIALSAAAVIVGTFTAEVVRSRR